MINDVSARLRHHGIRPSAHRLAIAEFVLHTHSHPSADHVFEAVRKTFPVVSRATVYNTLNLFVDKGLLLRLVVDPGRVVYDPDLSPHHHLIDEDTGAIYDIPWDALKVPALKSVGDFDVTGCHVVMRGRNKRARDSD